MVPLLARPNVDAEGLARFGVFGCEAGRHLAAVTVGGAISPCSFAPASNASALDLASAFTNDSHLAAFRAPPDAAPCRDCGLREVCRGGCRIVASHLEGDPSRPDPECPRVRAHARA
jgi:radical SAM protein with 4Fe4S-binding SPASM domain